jgi:anti-sigma factor RsiW
MTVSRDVIYDLLPAYFSGDASGDTRVLVEEYLATDPELKKMAERFGRLMPGGGASTSPGEADRAKAAFTRARSRVKLRMAALGWALGAAFGFFMAIVTSSNGRWGFAHPGVIIGIVFTGSAVAMLLMSFSAHPERFYAAFTGSDRGPGR